MPKVGIVISRWRPGRTRSSRLDSPQKADVHGLLKWCDRRRVAEMSLQLQNSCRRTRCSSRKSARRMPRQQHRTAVQRGRHLLRLCALLLNNGITPVRRISLETAAGGDPRGRSAAPKHGPARQDLALRAVSLGPRQAATAPGGFHKRRRSNLPKSRSALSRLCCVRCRGP